MTKIKKIFNNLIKTAFYFNTHSSNSHMQLIATSNAANLYAMTSINCFLDIQAVLIQHSYRVWSAFLFSNMMSLKGLYRVIEAHNTERKQGNTAVDLLPSLYGSKFELNTHG
jgi:hypothetical protein